MWGNEKWKVCWHTCNNDGVMLFVENDYWERGGEIIWSSELCLLDDEKQKKRGQLIPRFGSWKFWSENHLLSKIE